MEFLRGPHPEKINFFDGKGQGEVEKNPHLVKGSKRKVTLMRNKENKFTGRPGLPQKKKLQRRV